MSTETTSQQCCTCPKCIRDVPPPGYEKCSTCRRIKPLEEYAMPLSKQTETKKLYRSCLGCRTTCYRITKAKRDSQPHFQCLCGAYVRPAYVKSHNKGKRHLAILATLSATEAEAANATPCSAICQPPAEAAPA